MSLQQFRWSSLLALVIGLSLSASSAFANVLGVIRGQIVDQNGEPIIGAVINLDSENVRNKGLGAVTDVEGSFVIGGVYPATVTLEINYPGFITRKIEVTVAVDQVVDLDIDLEEDIAEAGGAEIVVEEVIDIATVEAREGNRTVFTQQELEDFPWPGDSFQSVIERVPGASRGPDGSIHIQGGRDDQLAWKIDGFDMTDPVTNTFGMNLNLNSIESMEVITGGFGAEYGQAMSGVVNVVTKSGGDQFHGSVELDYSNDSITDAVFGSQDTVSYVERPFTNAFEAYTPWQQANIREKKRNEYIEFSPEFYLEGPIIPDRLTFTSSFGFTSQERDRDYLTAQREWTGYNGNIKLTYRASKEDSFVLNARFDRAEIDYDEIDVPEGSNQNQLQDTSSVSLEYTHQFNPLTSFTVGYEYRYQNLRRGNTADASNQQPREQVSVYSSNGADPIWDFLRRTVDPSIQGPSSLPSYDIHLAGHDLTHYERFVYRNTVSAKMETYLGRRHRIKVGAEISDLLYEDQFTWTGGTTYRYSTGRGWVFDPTLVPDYVPGTVGDERVNPFLASFRPVDFPGLFSYRRQSDYGYLGPEYERGISPQKVDSRGQIYGVYAQDEWSALPNLSINFGIRLDILDTKLPTLNFADVYGDPNDYPSLYAPNDPSFQLSEAGNPPNARGRNDLFNVDVAPRISLEYTPAERLRLIGSYGIFFNKTSLQYIVLQDASRAYQTRTGNPGTWQQWEWENYNPSDVKSEKTYTYRISADYSFEDSPWSISSGSTWKIQDDLFTVREFDENRPGSEFGTIENVGEAKYWGVDFVIRRAEFQNWSLRFSYTYSEASGTLDYIDFLAQGDISLSANLGELYPLDWDVPHRFVGSAAYSVPFVPGLRFTSNFSYDAGYPFTPNYITSLNGVTSQVFSGGRNTSRLPDRTSVDMTAMYNWIIDEQYSMRFYLELFNVFNNYNVLEVQDFLGNAVVSAQRRRYLELGLEFKF